MKTKNSAGLFLLIALCLSNITESQIVIENKIHVKAEALYADNFDNVYILSENKLLKYNSTGEKIAEYSPTGGDKITYLDVNNSFKCLLVFKDQNKIIFLDNKLSVLSELILTDMFNLYGDPLICSSSLGGFWLFDNQKNQLLKLNADFILEYKRNLKKIKQVVSVSEIESNILFLTETQKLFIYNYNSQEMSEFLMDSEKKTSNNQFEINFFNAKNSTIESYSPNNDVLLNDLIMLPEEIMIINAVIGNQKVYFYDENIVYFSSREKN